MEKDSTIRAVRRALLVLQAVNRLRSSTLRELANETGLPYPTTFRIVQTLMGEGMIEQEPYRKRYRPTELVKSLSLGFQEDDRLLNAAIEPMDEFTSTYFWPIAISVRVGNRMMVKHSTHALTSQTFVNYFPGHTVPLFGGASGQAYLAFCDEQERQTLLSGSVGQGSDTDPNRLLFFSSGELLAKIRKNGYADVARGSYNDTPGKTSTIAVPVFYRGRLRACLAIVFFASAHSIQDAVAKYLAPLQQLSLTITKALEEQG